MYATKDEVIKMAHDAWASAESTRNALRRKLDKAMRAADEAGYGAPYAAAMSEARLIEVQHKAVAELTEQRWAHFMELGEGA